MAKIQIPSPKSGRPRPSIAILAHNPGTETTDLIVPYGILKESGAADVHVVSTRGGAVRLTPALRIGADMTIAEFDQANPQGADIVIVPNIDDNKNREAIDWVGGQSKKGAFVVSICQGAWILARAGVLDGKRATTHWYVFDSMAKLFPKIEFVRNLRYIADGNAMSTSGITASIPASLAIVEAIAGQETAKATAERLGVKDWDAEYDASDFKLNAGRTARIISNALSIWAKETIELPIEEGFDEIALALAADGWSRTYRSQAVATHASCSVRSLRGLVVKPDGAAKAGRPIMAFQEQPAGLAFDETLQGICTRYGQATANVVALQLEYPLKDSSLPWLYK